MDSLRAVAALAVVVTHTVVFSGFSNSSWWGALWHNLDVGVPIFFAISGFLLYRPFLAAQVLGAPRTTTAAYAWRRVLRIVPAYWLALTFLAWYANLSGVFTHDWWRYYFFLQIYSRHTLYGGIVPAWTLCVEVTFYAFLPLYAAAMARLTARAGRRTRIRLELAALAVLATASVALRTLDLISLKTVLQNSILENFDWFAGGMVLAVVSVAAEDRQPLAAVARLVRRLPVACWIGAAALYVAAAGLIHNPSILSAGLRVYTPGRGLVLHVAFGVIAVLFVAPAMFQRERSLPARVLAWRVLAWLGLISYGIYLWHDPLLGKLLHKGAIGWWPHHAFLVLTAATTAATIVAATVSYYAVERPILSFKSFTLRRRRPRVPAPRSGEPVRSETAHD